MDSLGTGFAENITLSAVFPEPTGPSGGPVSLNNVVRKGAVFDEQPSPGLTLWLAGPPKKPFIIIVGDTL